MKITQPIPQETALMMLGALRLAVQYLDHPQVQEIPFALAAESAADRVRTAIEEAEKCA